MLAFQKHSKNGYCNHIHCSIKLMVKVLSTVSALIAWSHMLKNAGYGEQSLDLHWQILTSFHVLHGAAFCNM